MGKWYPPYLEEMFTRTSAASQASTASIKAILLDATYTYSDAHNFLDDIVGTARVGTAGTLTSTSFTNGIFSATGPIITALSGDVVTQMAVYIDTGSEATSWLMCHIDDASVFPLTPGGADQPIVWTPQPLTKTAFGDGYFWYPLAAEAFFTRPANSDIEAGVVKAVLIDEADYTYNAAHDFLNDIPAGARVGTPQTIGNKTFTAGVFSSTDPSITFPSLTGDQCEAMVFYLDTGTESTSRLLLYCRNSQGLPVTPNGLDQPVYRSSGGWARIGGSV